MIHTLFELSRPLFMLDVETTGLSPEIDRIVEIGFQMWTAAGMVKEWQSLVDPLIPIPPAISRLNGITNEMVRDAYSFSTLAPSLAKGFQHCDYCGQNVRFDLRMIDAEMKRCRVEWSYADANIIDTKAIEALIQPQSLAALHLKYVGQPHDNAHGALSDARATAAVLGMQLTQHVNLPRDLESLHKLQWADWIDTEGKFRFVHDIPCFGNWGRYRGKSMREADSGYWEWIIRNNFSEEIKAIARKAQLGEFPIK